MYAPGKHAQKLHIFGVSLDLQEKVLPCHPQGVKDETGSLADLSRLQGPLSEHSTKATTGSPQWKQCGSCPVDV